MRKTKIICTIGPSSEKPEVFRAMCLAGLNVARLNFSHGTHEENSRALQARRAVSFRSASGEASLAAAGSYIIDLLSFLH